MFHVKVMGREEMNRHYTEVKRDILCRMPDAGEILPYLAAKDVAVHFVVPGGASQPFNAAADAGSVSVLQNSIFIDLRKPLEQQADDLARRTRALMRAPQPSGVERFLFDSAGVTFGRFMKLEAKDGF